MLDEMGYGVPPQSEMKREREIVDFLRCGKGIIRILSHNQSETNCKPDVRRSATDAESRTDGRSVSLARPRADPLARAPCWRARWGSGGGSGLSLSLSHSVAHVGPEV